MDLLFWSGGKDALLALKIYREKYPDRSLELLTTFNEKMEQVPHQRIPISKIKKQAQALNLPLNLVPLPEECPNETYLKKVDAALKDSNETIDYLVFGDWHLDDIRKWREEQFGALGYSCRFPIWNKSIHELLPLLLFQPIEVRISAVRDDLSHLIKVGELYNQHFVQQLPQNIDPLGENGEFHTEVIFESWDKGRSD